MNVQTSGPRYAVFAALVAAATMAFAGCGGGGGGGSSLSNCLGYGGGGGGTGGAGSCGPQQSAPSPSPTPDTGAQPVALLLTGQSSVNIAPYGGVLGYNNGNSAAAFATGSNVVNLTANQAMQFFNTEASGGNPHTASSLGAWSGSFPASGPTSAQQNASAVNTPISAPGFSTGTLEPGQVSRVYNSGAPGMTIIGCFYHYLSNDMRTVAIVM